MTAVFLFVDGDDETEAGKGAMSLLDNGRVFEYMTRMSNSSAML